MANRKIINLPVDSVKARDRKDCIHWIVSFKRDGAGCCNFGYDDGTEKYPWVAVVVGRTRGELLSLMATSADRLENEDSYISLEANA